jgi:hypothetical protein
MQNNNPIVNNFYQVFDFEGGDDFIPNGLDYDTTDVLFKTHGFVGDEVMNYYYENHVQIPVLKELLNIHQDITQRIGLHKYDELYKENKDNVFVYPIEPFANIDHILGNEYSYSHTPIINFISKKSYQLIQDPKNKFYLLINFCNEGTVRPYVFTQLHKMIEDGKIPFHKVIFVTAAADLEVLYEKFCKENKIPIDQRLKVIYRTWSISNKVDEAVKILEPREDERQINIDQNFSTLVLYDDLDKSKIRNNRFLYLNRRMRDQRVLLLALLGTDFIKDNLISYDWTTVHHEPRYDYVETRLEEKYWVHTINNMIDISNNLSKSWVDFENVIETVGFGCEVKEPYLDSYINITSETNFYDAGVYFSEKTWKPILNLQPFISVNYPHSLKYLKKMGFRTFSPFIDETYDTIECPKKRMGAIYNEVLRLNSLSIEEIHNWYYSIIDDLKYNRELLLTFTGEKMLETDANYIYGIKNYIISQHKKHTSNESIQKNKTLF